MRWRAVYALVACAASLLPWLPRWLPTVDGPQHLRLIAFVLEENGFPVAPAILGVVLGQMMEENFITSMIKSDGDPTVFFTRPIAMGLAIATFVILLWPVGAWLWRHKRGGT